MEQYYSALDPVEKVWVSIQAMREYNRTYRRIDEVSVSVSPDIYDSLVNSGELILDEISGDKIFRGSKIKVVHGYGDEYISAE